MGFLFEVRSTSRAGNALFSNAEIPAESIIASFTTFLTARQAAGTDHVRAHLKSLDFSQLPALNEKIVLTLYLVCCVDDDDDDDHSSNAPALRPRELMQMLPTTVQNGVWRDDEDLHLTQLWPAVMAKRRTLQAQWSSLARNLCAFETWVWADAVISSRTIGLDSTLPFGHDYSLDQWYSAADQEQIFDIPSTPKLCLVPTLDLANHAGGKCNARWDVSEDLILLLSTKDISAGDEITISYGDEKDNDELWFNYGFIMDDNINWSVSLTVPAPEGSINSVEYLQEVQQTFELHNVIRITSSSVLNKDCQAPVARIMKDWNREGMLSLTESDVAILLLSYSQDVLHSTLIPSLFSEDDVPDEQVEEWNRIVHSQLLTVLEHSVIEQERLECQAQPKSIGRQLISEKLGGCHRILQECRRADSIN